MNAPVVEPARDQAEYERALASRLAALLVAEHRRRHVDGDTDDKQNDRNRGDDLTAA